MLDKSNTLCYTKNMKTMIAETLVEWDENKNSLTSTNMASVFRLPHWYLPTRSGLNTSTSCTVRTKTDMWCSDAFRESCMLFTPCAENMPD